MVDIAGELMQLHVVVPALLGVFQNYTQSGLSRYLRLACDVQSRELQQPDQCPDLLLQTEVAYA